MMNITRSPTNPMTQKERQRINWRKMPVSTAAVLGGASLFAYGGIDDSPGGQLLGLLVVISDIYDLVRVRKRGQRRSEQAD